jgi:hypothetical protein
MNRKPWITAIGAMGIAVATGCNKSSSSPSSGSPSQDAADWAGLKDYLKPGGPLNTYLDNLQKAVCQLESKSTAPLDPAKRICPKGEGGPDVKPPPAYPPR